MFADVSNLCVHEDVAAIPCVPQSHSALAETCVVRAWSPCREHCVRFQLGDLTFLRAGTVAGR